MIRVTQLGRWQEIAMKKILDIRAALLALGLVFGLDGV